VIKVVEDQKKDGLMTSTVIHYENQFNWDQHRGMEYNHKSHLNGPHQSWVQEKKFLLYCCNLQIILFLVTETAGKPGLTYSEIGTLVAQTTEEHLTQ